MSLGSKIYRTWQQFFVVEANRGGNGQGREKKKRKDNFKVSNLGKNLC